MVECALITSLFTYTELEVRGCQQDLPESTTSIHGWIIADTPQKCWSEEDWLIATSLPYTHAEPYPTPLLPTLNIV